PASEFALVVAGCLVEVGIVPDAAVQHAAARYAAHVDGRAGAHRLHRLVPARLGGVGDAGAYRKIRVDAGAEAQHGHGSRLQVAVDGGEIRPQLIARERDSGDSTV